MHLINFYNSCGILCFLFLVLFLAFGNRQLFSPSNHDLVIVPFSLHAGRPYVMTEPEYPRQGQQHHSDFRGNSHGAGSFVTVVEVRLVIVVFSGISVLLNTTFATSGSTHMPPYKPNISFDNVPLIC